MNIYYIDYENVNSFGLKGVQLLTEDCQVNILYSKKADNVKIDALSELMKSKAEIHFIPVHVGTPNALDFQLITLLFLRYEKGNHYYIISKDSGYDCCIKTAQDCGAPDVKRFRDIESAAAAVSGNTAASDVSASEADPSPAVSSGPVTPGPAVSEAVSSETVSSETVSPETVLPESVHADTVQSEAAPRHSRRRRRSSRSGERRAEPAEPLSRQNAADAAQTVSVQAAQAQIFPDLENAGADSSQNGIKTESSVKKTQPDSDSRYPAEKITEVISKRCGFEPDEKQLSVIRDVLLKAKNKQQFYSFMVRRCGQKEGLALYHTIRCAYNDLLAVENR